MLQREADKAWQVWQQSQVVSRLGAQNTQNVGAHGGEGACTLSAKIDNRHWERINVGTLRKKRNSKKDNEITPV